MNKELKLHQNSVYGSIVQQIAKSEAEYATNDMSFLDWYPTKPIIEPHYVDLKSTIDYFYSMADITMNLYDAFSGFKSFDAQSLWIKESWKWRVRAKVCEGKYCTLTSKERIDDAIKEFKKFNNALEYYKTHKSTIRWELSTT